MPGNAALKSWLPVGSDCDFPIQNLPYGVFERSDGTVACGVAIGDQILDLAALHRHGGFKATALANNNVFASCTLNAFMAAGRTVWTEIRSRITQVLSEADPTIRDHPGLRAAVLLPMSEARLRLPVSIPNFADFYASKYHATNVGSMFRDPSSPLLPNWVHMPVAYNGRSSSVIVSGEPVRRPCGQTKADDQPGPGFGPSRLLDFELEVGFFVGSGNELGTSIPARRASDHIFGLVLVNDWSARDIQKWEYVPLGPFLGKSFATSISPWVVPLDALEPFRVTPQPQNPEVLPYLRCPGDWAYDLHLEVHLQANPTDAPQCITRSNLRHLYWTLSQMLAHVTVNGTNAQTGDLYGSGTVSGPTPESRGCLLELTWKGQQVLVLPGGKTRTFLADGDTVIMRGYGQGDGYRVGFGEVRSTILPAE